MIWFIGDSVLEDAIREFAGEEEFVSTATPGATPEEVWTTQKHFGRRKWDALPTIVCFLAFENYDSEATVWHLLSAVPQGSKILYLYHPGGDVREGLDHYDKSLVTPIEISSTSKNEVLEALNESR